MSNQNSVQALVELLPQLPPADGKAKIVRRDELSSHLAAERALTDARTLAANITQDMMTTMQEAGEQGYRDGRQRADEELSTELHRVQQQLQEFYREANPTIATLAVKIAEKFIGRMDRDETTVNIMRDVIREHLANEPYSVQVAADTQTPARIALESLRREYPQARLPTVRLDTRLPNGRAILVTRFGSVDLDLKSQLETIRRSLITDNVTPTHNPTQ